MDGTPRMRAPKTLPKKRVPLSLKSPIESRQRAGMKLRSPGDAVLIIRQTPRLLLLKCPCGCGDEIPINLDSRAGQAWRVYSDSNKSFTLYPSVWRKSGCMSHFIIRKDSVELISYGESWECRYIAEDDLLLLKSQIFEAWSWKGWVPYAEIADQFNEIPWDILDACRSLVRNGVIVEGDGERRMQFRRVE